MRIGIRLRTWGMDVSPAGMARTARSAAELGFASLWVADHVVMPEQVDSRYPYSRDQRWPARSGENWLDPLIALGWAGANAHGIELGTSVIVVPLRHPVLLAKQVATLDDLLGGRVVLGVGVGWMREEFEAVGIPFTERWTRTIEAVRVMRALWTGQPVSFAGRHFEIDQVVSLPAPRRVPPILWGGHTKKALQAAVDLGDGWHPTGLKRSAFEDALRQLHETCERSSRDPRSLRISVSLARSERPTRAVAEWYAERGAAELVWTPQHTDQDALCDELQETAAACGITRASPSLGPPLREPLL